jgi:ATP-dependent DNA helicase RecG
MLSTTFSNLRAALEAEEKSGFEEQGIRAAAVCTQAQRALDEIARGERPQSEEFAIQRLHDLWREYSQHEAAERARIVDATQRMLENTNAQHSANGGSGISVQKNNRLLLEDQSPKTKEESPKTQNSKLQTPNSQSCDSEITYLKGIGPRRATLLQKLGVFTVYDLLHYFPARYEDRRGNKAICDLQVGEKEGFTATVLFDPQTRTVGGRGGNRKLTIARVGDDTGRIDLQWWNQPFREKQLPAGTQLFVFGKIGHFNGALQVDAPEIEIAGEGDEAQTGRIVPVYPATEGLLQSALRKAILTAFDKCPEALEEVLPPAVLERFELQSREWSLRQIHFPDDWDSQEAARERLLFEELFLLQVALAQKKAAAHVEEIGIRHVVEDEKIKEFVRALPFKLTGAQKRVMNDIRRDLKSAHPMNRLLHGDVGSGKTIVAAYALWTAHVSGRQGALLAPTEILAEQHFSSLTHLFKPFGIEVALLEGSLKSKQKQRIQADLNEGRVSIVVGTHALIQEAVEFNNLSVAVVDEQHRFGVMQRAALAHKGPQGLKPDVLVMTATPIPRTMALTVYGDLDVSVLDELPPGRQPIKTVKIKPQQRERAYQFVRDEVQKGRQAYVVCPLVEESEKLAHLKAASALAENLRMGELQNLRIGLVHGQMSAVEREEQMELFRAGMWDVLVSTTVIEVGVDVPNATVMLIEDAERFGLSQLHQLRGRVGRGEHKSTCVLLGDPKTDDGKARLQVMTKTTDGFLIAEQDLALRGPGEFYGTRQSGLPDFRLANIISDVDAIQVAREAAFELVQSDPHLQHPDHQKLKRAIHRFWGDKLALVQVS